MQRVQQAHFHRTDFVRSVARDLVCVLGGVVCVSACSAPQATIEDYRPPLDPREEEAIVAAELRIPEAAVDGLEAALKRYQANDDLYGQWRVSLMLARLQLAQGQQDAAVASVEQVQNLTRQLDQPELAFQSAILMGRAGGGEPLFQRALDYAETPLERALALTYLGEYEQAVDTIEPVAIDRPADRAFVHFRYAVSRQSPPAMERALKYYKVAGDSRGIADSLVYLARWSAAAGDHARARDYAERAIRVLAASDDEQRAAAVADWLRSLP